MMTLADVEESLSAVVVAMTLGSDYAQNGQNTALVETGYLDLVATGRSLGHLSFSVDTLTERQTVSEQHRATVAVRYLYHLRSDRQRSDKRLAQRLAKDIRVALLDPGSDWFGLQADTPYRDQADESAEWLLVTMLFTATFDPQEGPDGHRR